MSPRAQRILNEAVLKAIGVCLEGMPSDAFVMHQFARSHGVILTDDDILDSLDEHVRTRRSTSEITPIGEPPAALHREDTP